MSLPLPLTISSRSREYNRLSVSSSLRFPSCPPSPRVTHSFGLVPLVSYGEGRKNEVMTNRDEETERVRSDTRHGGRRQEPTEDDVKFCILFVITVSLSISFHLSALRPKGLYDK